MTVFSFAGPSGSGSRRLPKGFCSLTHWRAARQLKNFSLFSFLLFVTTGIGFSQAAPPAPVSAVQLISPLRPVVTIVPGGSYQEALVLENSGDTGASVQISQVDYLPDLTETLYPEPGSLPRSNAPWITLSRSEVELKAGEQVTVPYQIRVPDDPALAGSYWSMILLEPSDAVNTRSTAEPGGVRTSVQTRFRYGVSVLTDLGSSGQSGLSFTEPVFVQPEQGNGYLLRVNLQNVGERVLEPEVWLELVDARGTRLGRIEGGEQRVFPGGAAQAQFSLGALPPGDYQALVIADAGGERVFGVRYTLNVAAPQP
jgi:hypothetical protein